VICAVYPERGQELYTYMALIVDLNLMNGKNIFVQYHKAFACKADLHISQYSRLDWATLDTELLILVVGGTQTCPVLLVGHQAPICPSAAFQPPLQGRAIIHFQPPLSSATRWNGSKRYTCKERRLFVGNLMCLYYKCFSLIFVVSAEMLILGQSAHLVDHYGIELSKKVSKNEMLVTLKGHLDEKVLPVDAFFLGSTHRI